MRIARPNSTLNRARQIGAEIAEAASARGIEGRVCGASCTLKCGRCGSVSCQCECSPYCPEAPRALSVDPDRHPIEPAVTPLVFEMKRLGMFSPCWSCEGHQHADGSLWKVPRVWFYCVSMVHVRLLADGLENLKFAGKVRASWKIVVTYSDQDNPETTFSLEPVLSPGNDFKLSDLQKDVAEIARSFGAMMAKEALALQREAGKSQVRDR